MLDSLKHRGKDSTGVTIAGQECTEDLILRLWTDGEADEDFLARVDEGVAECGGIIKSRRLWDKYLRLTVNYEGDIKALAEALIKAKDAHIHSIGRVLRS